ncbi:carbon catabolite repressor protein 4 homolog 5 isoform X2 [Silene latifolia]|uniref:carbon catabolite repressor protein 4 homolog 5 isoform X2 n=1 Tax=Silene latifolia TaxID=37657 RepID=UPI003D77B44D
MNTNNRRRKRYSPPQRSHKFIKKRKFGQQQRQSQTLTNWGRNNHAWSGLKQCRSIQSSSYGFNLRTDVSRKWSYSSRDFSGFEDRIVIVSYNILGVENALKHPYLYRNISPKHLDWDHRKTLIRKELRQYNPSILCFQACTYLLLAQARTGDACDGCAIFWKHERFVLLHEEHIDFHDFGLRDNVAQFCVLTTGDACRRLLVGNIHVLYNPKRGDIKLGQIRLYLEKAYKLSQEWGDIPIVLAGDFNSYPQSAVYQYISSGKLEMLQHDRRNISGQVDVPHHIRPSYSLPKESQGQMPLVQGWSDEELKLATGCGGVTCLEHNLKLHSAYLGVPGNITTRDEIGEPSETTCHSLCTGTVDYIWHTDGLVPFRVLETLPRSVLGETGGLPSEKWGSDHLALVCDFAFVDDES